MTKLLRFNLRKLRMQKTFYIFTGVCLVLIAFLAVIIKVLKSLSGNASPEEQLTMSSVSFMTSPTGFFLAAVSQSSFTMLIGVVIALMVCDDFEQHTIRHIYARGYSRLSYYIAKAISAVVAVTIAFAAATLVAFVLTRTMFGEITGKPLKIAAILALQYGSVLAISSFVFALSFIFRRTGVAIAAALLAPDIIGMILGLVGLVPAIQDWELSKYWMSSFLMDLSSVAVDRQRMTVILVASVIYGVGFLAAGYFLRQKSEV